MNSQINHIGEDAPLLPFEGMLWFDAANNTLKIYKKNQWIPYDEYVGGNVSEVVYVGSNEPTEKTIILWVDTRNAANPVLKIRGRNGWVSVGSSSQNITLQNVTFNPSPNSIPLSNSEGKIHPEWLADNSITSAKIQSQAITSQKLGPNSVTSSKIVKHAITTEKFHPSAVAPNSDKVDGFHIFEWKNSKGLIIPFYRYPYNNGWDSEALRLINLIKETGVHAIVIVNPSSGPGNGVDLVYKRFINMLKGSGAIVIGYVKSDYGQRDLNDIISDIQKWKEFYPNVDGIFIDEVEYEVDVERHNSIYRVCKDEGFKITVGNPGSAIPENKIDSVPYELIVVDENIGLNLLERHPTFEGDWENSYREKNRNRFCGIAYNVESLSINDFINYSKYFSYVYITDKHGGNPYNSLPTYFEKLVGFAVSGNIYYGLFLANLIGGINVS